MAPQLTESVNQELLLQNEYLAAENRILRAKLPSRLRLSDPERATLAEIGKRVGRKVLREPTTRSRHLAVVDRQRVVRSFGVCGD